MRLSALTIIALTFIAAAYGSLMAANYSVTLIEDNSEIEVRDSLDAADMPWAEVEADGLKVTLAGVAPTEALRFKALSTAGGIVDSARIIDEMDVQATADIAPPRFSVEILRNDGGLSVIGLIPSDTDRESLTARFERIAGDTPVTDLLETADYDLPDGWIQAFEYALTSLDELPRSKVSASPGRVSITAITDSNEERVSLEQSLRRAAPPSLKLSLALSAPRPVITPFLTRFVLDETGTRFDACAADTDAAKDTILTAARAIGLADDATCTVGMGVPSPAWATANVAAIEAVAALGSGIVTVSDADVSLLATEGTDQDLFDRTVGELEAALPEVFVLNAVLPEVQDPTAGPPEFTATLSPEGQVQLRGRLSDQNLRDVADSYAKASFGSTRVYTATRIVPDLPTDWSVRVLAGLESLRNLANGAVTVTPTTIDVSGNTGDADANASISRLLTNKLGDSAVFSIDVTYQKKLDPILGIPTPDECEAEIATLLTSGGISFEPGSGDLAEGAGETMDDIAAILKRCGDLRMEIQGHTDSQGRDIMNQELSEARAQSVLQALRDRRVLTASFTSQGYGETVPIADNKTEEGREANRRIEFVLIRPKPSAPEQPTTLEQVESTLPQIEDTTETQEQASE